MFDKLLKTMETAAREAEARDQQLLAPPLERFAEPLAQRVSWHPNLKGGANFRTSALRVGADGRFRIAPSMGALAFGLAFLIPVAIGFFLITPLVFRAAFGPIWLLGVLPLGLGALLVGAITLLVDTATRPYVFDEAKGLHRRSSVFASLFSWRWLQERAVPRDQLGGLQILAEKLRGDGGPVYYSFELNLVTREAERVTLQDHKDVAAIRADAQALSRAFGLPVWDATEGRF